MKPHRRRLTKWPVIRQLRPLWYPIAVRLRSSSVAVTTLPGLVGQPGQRQLLSEIRTFERNLPDRLRRPLPEVMTELTAITAPTMPKPAGRDHCSPPGRSGNFAQPSFPIGCLPASLSDALLFPAPDRATRKHSFWGSLNQRSNSSSQPTSDDRPRLAHFKRPALF